MMNIATARRIALSMPEAEQKRHHGHPDFRVKNKIFATLWPKENRAVLKLSLGDQHNLVESSPRIFSKNAWSHQGWTNVHLKEISEKLFRDLVERAWRNVAPKRLVPKHATERFQPQINTDETHN
jgi:hypothetical protein